MLLNPVLLNENTVMINTRKTQYILTRKTLFLFNFSFINLEQD